MEVIAKQNDTLDLICWRVFGKTNGIVEEAIKINPHITKTGSILPIGTAITLPNQVVSTEQVKMINLWD